MINLLPPQQKVGIYWQEKSRLVTILGICLLVPLVCLALILLSVRLFILADVNYQSIILAYDKQKYQTADFLKFSNIITSYNAQMVQAEAFYHKALYVSDALEVMWDVARPQGLYITDLSLASNESGDSKKIAISGVSNSRDDLLVFQKNLQQNQRIANVYVSPESWVNATNVKFNITFEVDGTK